jgi:polyphosphate kinase 2 (PPK2 family)
MESRRLWEQYTKAKETMLERTHIPEAPWWIVEAVRRQLTCPVGDNYLDRLTNT